MGHTAFIQRSIHDLTTYDITAINDTAHSVPLFKHTTRNKVFALSKMTLSKTSCILGLLACFLHSASASVEKQPNDRFRWKQGVDDPEEVWTVSEVRYEGAGGDRHIDTITIHCGNDGTTPRSWTFSTSLYGNRPRFYAIQRKHLTEIELAPILPAQPGWVNFRGMVFALLGILCGVPGVMQMLQLL